MSLDEAIKYAGVPYVFGGYSETGFDCSGFVCYVLKHSGIKDIPRMTAEDLYNICYPISPQDTEPGDLVFFKGTYDTGDSRTITHVGFYLGDGKMYDAEEPTVGIHKIWGNYESLYARIPLP